jgi:hypothetical protein
VNPYDRLVELAERQLAAVSEGRWEELDELQAEQAALVASLPDAPPPHARDALERAAAANDRARAITQGTHGALQAEMGRLRTGQRALGAYAAASRTA